MTSLIKVKKETYRSIGAVTGLALGTSLMYLVGLSGVMPLAICGAVGAIAGGITGERIHAAKHTDDGP